MDALTKSRSSSVQRLSDDAGKDAYKTTVRNSSSKSGVTRPTSLAAYAIEVLSPKRNFIKWEVRGAMKTVDKQLAKLDQALASDAVLATVTAKEKLLAALDSLAKKSPKDAQYIQARFNAQLLKVLPTLSDSKLETLDGFLTSQTDSAAKTTIPRIHVSVLAELLQRKTDAIVQEFEILDGDIGSVSMKELRVGQLRQISALGEIADKLLDAVHTVGNAEGVLSATRFTEDQLRDLQTHALNASNQLAAGRKAGLALLAEASDKLADMSIEKLKKVRGAIEFITPEERDTDPKHLALLKTVDARFASLEKEITRKVIGRAPFNANALKDDQLLALDKKIAALPHKPEVLEKVRTQIQEVIAERQQPRHGASKDARPD